MTRSYIELLEDELPNSDPRTLGVYLADKLLDEKVDIELVDYLITAGADLAIWVNPPIIPGLGCIEPDNYIIDTIMAFKPNIGFPALHLAVLTHNITAVELILLGDPHSVKYTDRYKCSAIHYAAASGYIDIVEKLLQYGRFQIFDQNNICRSPLHYASRNNKTEMVELLINNNAVINDLDHWGYTPLNVATSNGSTNAAKLLIHHGADVNIPDNLNNSPLHYACTIGMDCLDLIKLLLEKGADITTKNKIGKTPWVLAPGIMQAVLPELNPNA